MKYVLALIVLACSFTFSASAELLYLSSLGFKSCAPPAMSLPTFLPPNVGNVQIGSYGFGGVDTGANGTSKPVLQSLTFSKDFDSCSGQLATNFLTSTYLSQVTLLAYQSNSGSASATKPDLTITLSGVVVTKYMLAGGGSDTQGTEQITLAFTKACIVTANANY